jgi:VWFA-related protein
MKLALRIAFPLLLTLPLFAQQPIPQPEQLQQGLKIPDTVTLDVTVTSRNNPTPVAGLTEPNFTILDNGAAAKILSFKAVKQPADDPPIQVYILLDTVNSNIQLVSIMRDRIAEFLKKSGPTLPYPLSFVVLSDKGAQIPTTPSTSTADLLADLNNIQTQLRTITRSTGFYGALERVQISLSALDQFAQVQHDRPGRKLLIWIGPGWPYLSGTGIDLTSRDRIALFNNVVSLSTLLELSRVTLSSVDPSGVTDAGTYRTFFYESFLKGLPSYKNAEWGNLTVQVLAIHSGGQVLNSGNNIAGEIAQCIDDASAFYVITIPRARAEEPNTLHTIQVKIPDTNLKPRTIFGYYAQP